MEKIRLAKKKLQIWTQKNYLPLAIFIILVMLMVLLRSAGYFYPYLTLSVNFIVLAALILSLFLFRLRSKVMFMIALIFWIFAGAIKVAGIDIWAERTAIYAYQTFVIGTMLLLIENFGFINKKKSKRSF